MIEENIIQHTKRFSYAIEAYTYMSGIWVLDMLQLRTLSFFEISYDIKHCGHDMIDIIFPVIDVIVKLYTSESYHNQNTVCCCTYLEVSFGV
ncbi:hypothetical protein L208DRAFT_751742 [Tricholoma matsutake]|nr:hypothetical protein L208DRAFT_751742 [Tricholoma matsutake 945]